ncbi:MAG TPA: NAD-dependent epimerase/dehydratase family protein [Bryobacteraceae bacterium]|nr:NAD-dependent epimerase/dehydratase family protein [Bryobacteraceae bacterium]
MTAVSTGIIREDAGLIVRELSQQLSLLNGATLLVTGASGFLCSHFLETVAVFNETARPGCRLLAVDNFKTGLPERLAWISGRRDIEFRQCDVSIGFEPGEPVDWIIHGAGIASPPVYRQFPLDTIDVNVNGTRHMLELLRRGGRGMLLLSSSEIYGDPDPAHIPTAEDYRGYVSSTGPRACYDESKRLGETLAVTYYRLYGSPVKIIRPFNVYGPGQRLDDGRIIPSLMSAAYHRQPIVLYSDGRATRSFCYVRDAIRGMLLVLLSPVAGEAFNVGNDEEISIGELAHIAAALDGPPLLPIRFETSADRDYLCDNPQRRCPDLAKLRNVAAWEPQVMVREGLARTLQSYREGIHS